jgi:hypothetical protein
VLPVTGARFWRAYFGCGRAGGRRGEIAPQELPRQIQAPQTSRSPPSPPRPMPMERKQAAYTNLVSATRPSPPPRWFVWIPVSAELGGVRDLQDEKYAIRGEKYQGQQYSHIYFTRLHHMRNLLHALVPSWKPQLPGLCPRSPPLSFLPIPVNLVDKLKSFFVILWSLML